MSIGKDINTEAYFNALFAAKENLLKEAELMGRASLAELMEDMGFPQEWENRGIDKGIDKTLLIIKMLTDNIPPELIAEELQLPLEKILTVKSSLIAMITRNPQS